MSSAIGNFAFINRVIQCLRNKRSRKHIPCAIGSDFLTVAMLEQPFHDADNAEFGSGVKLKNLLDSIGFIVIDNQMPIFKGISIWGKTTVPQTVTGFLLSAKHGLRMDVLKLHFCQRTHDRCNHLTHRGTGVKTIGNTNQVYIIFTQDL